jgi:WD40 repeat protein
MKHMIALLFFVCLFVPLFPSSQPAAAAAGAGAGANANIEITEKKHTALARNLNLNAVLPHDLMHLVTQYACDYTPVTEIATNKYPIGTLAISADGNYLATSTFSTIDNPATSIPQIIIYQWDGKQFNKIDTIAIKNHASSIAVSPDGKYLATVGLGTKIEIYASKDNQYTLFQQINEHFAFSTFAFWQRGNSLFFGCTSESNNIKLYTLKENTFTLSQELRNEHPKEAEHIEVLTRFSADGNTIVTTHSGILYIWKFQKKQNGEYEYVLTTTKISDQPFYRINLSPDGKYLATVESDRAPVKIWKLDENIMLLQEIAVRVGDYNTITPYSDIENPIQFSADASYLCITTTYDVRIFKKNNQNLYKLLSELTYEKSTMVIDHPQILAFAPDLFHAVGKLSYFKPKLLLFQNVGLALCNNTDEMAKAREDKNNTK